MLESIQSTALSQYAGITRAVVTMTSREMADLTGKRHDSVKRTIDPLVEKGVIGVPQSVEYLDSIGRPASEYRIGKRDSYVIVAQLSPEFTGKVVDRWQELEANQSPILPNFNDPAAAAIAWAEQYRARQLAEETKAHIGHKREATAMATASVAVRKATRLEIELDRAKEYATVKRMEMAYHGTKFDWRLLKSTAAAMDMPAIDVFDQNYGTVKAYHADVWAEAYAVQIGGVA